jgi:hypothetical protein
MVFKTSHVRRVRSAVVMALSALVATAAGAHDRDRWHDGHDHDPVVFSFATVGDNRQDIKSPDPTTLLAVDPDTGEGGPSLTGTLLPQDKEYLQNSLAWTTIQQGIQAQSPNLLFFNGDMIYGYGRPMLPSAWANGQPNSWRTSETVSPDAFFEYAQYAYFRGVVSPLFNTGTYLMPVPGNHETQCSATAAPYSSTAPNPNCDTSAQGNRTGKTAYADNENAFRANMSDLVSDLVTNVRFSKVVGFDARNVAGLTPTTAPIASANNGAITSDQSALSYSFDIQATNRLTLHFVVINTDPAGADSTAPTDWLAADLEAAKGRGADKFFVFGHKPAYTYNYAAASGGTIAAAGLDANTNIALRDAFWSVMTKYHATYFCGHEHIPNVQKFADPTQANKGTAYQVIVGSGGSPFDDKLTGTCPSCTEPVLTNPYDRYYAWALVQVHKSGAVSLNLYGFSDDFGPTERLRKYEVDSLQ